MPSTSKHRLGAQFLAAGAGLSLLLKLYWLAQPSEYFSTLYRVISLVFGSWLAALVAPTTVDGGAVNFSLTYLLWAPWAAVFVAFLLWTAVMVLRGRLDRVLYPVLAILGVWLFVGFVYEKVSNGLYYFQLGLQWAVPSMLSDLAGLAMMTGIALLLIHRNEEPVVAGEGPYATQAMTLSHILFSFSGRINRARFWLYVLLLNVIWVVGLLIDVATTEEPGVFYVVGLLLTFWPSLALNVKRCHDRDKSGWFYLVAFIPLVSLWYLVEIGFLKGTEGDNRFGPDPLAP